MSTVQSVPKMRLMSQQDLMLRKKRSNWNSFSNFSFVQFRLAFKLFALRGKLIYFQSISTELETYNAIVRALFRLSNCSQ